MDDPLAIAVAQSKKIEEQLVSLRKSSPASIPTSPIDREALNQSNSLLTSLLARLAALENDSRANAKLWSDANLRSMNMESRLLRFEESLTSFVSKEDFMSLQHQKVYGNSISEESPAVFAFKEEVPSSSRNSETNRDQALSVDSCKKECDATSSQPADGTVVAAEEVIDAVVLQSVSKTTLWLDAQEPFLPEYQFRESAWDLAIFIGFKEIGGFGSFLAMLLCLINILVQLSFCILVFLNFTSDDFDRDARDGLELFRLTSHDAQHANTFNAYTLGQGICNNGKSFNWRMNRYHHATSQLSTLNAIGTYLSDEGTGIEEMFNGKLMCMLALVCWCLSGFREIRSICNFLGAILAIPLSSVTKLSRCEGDFHWNTISYYRFAVCVAIVILRLACCCFLIYCGCVWLSYTYDMENLLLNAVALAFVIDVDEIIFEVLAPLPCKAMIARAAPIQETRWIHFRGVDMFSMLSLLSLPLLTFLFVVFWVGDMISGMKDAKDILCLGNLTFSYSTDAMGMTWYQVWRPKRSNSFLSAMDSAGRKSVDQLKRDDLPYLANPTHSVMEVTTRQFSDLVDYVNYGCRDILRDDTHPERRYDHFLDVFVDAWGLSKELVNDCTSACAAMREFSFDEGRFVRFVCSETCGCRQPDAQIPSNSAYYGCSTHCFNTHEYKARLNGMPCNEPLVTDLAQSDFWNTWISFMNSTRARYGNLEASMWAEGMELHGCDFLSNVNQSVKLSLCEGTSPFVNMRAFAPICPESCGCKVTGGTSCNPFCLHSAP